MNGIPTSSLPFDEMIFCVQCKPCLFFYGSGKKIRAICIREDGCVILYIKSKKRGIMFLVVGGGGEYSWRSLHNRW